MSPLKTVDKDYGDIEEPMDEKINGKAANSRKPQAGWLNWAQQHPGCVMLGALVVALVALKNSPRISDTNCDINDEEVPLFI